MIIHPVRFLWINRSTHSDVMATSTTTEITALGGSSRLPKQSSAGNSFGIQLPSFLGKHLPVHVSVPSKRKSAALVKERDVFMHRLEQERNDRAVLETWAVIRIQTLVRGHLGRLRVDNIRRERGMKMSEEARRRAEEKKIQQERRSRQPQLSSSVFDADQLRAQLAELTAETDMYMELIGSTSARPEWKAHAKARSASDGGKKGRRKRRNRERVAAKHLQRVARGFLGRRATSHLRRRTKEFSQHMSAVRIQTQMRRVLGSMRVEEHRHKRQTTAASVIQRRARGWYGRVFARMYRIRLDNIQLEDTAAFTIQNSWKRHQANANQYKLEQEAAARRIQAIARGKRGRSDFQAKELLKEEQLEAAIRIQASFRAKTATKGVDEIRANRKKEMLARQHEQAAAVKVQALRRGKNARQAYKTKVTTRREKAALAIQKKSRMRKAKAKVERKRRKRDETKAAQSIQKIHRGKKGRRDFQEKRARDAVALEHEMERIEGNRTAAEEDAKAEAMEEELAIQRAQEEREQDAKDQLVAAEKIQAILRGKQGREAAGRRAAEKKKLEEMRAEEQRRAAAITRIQAAQRRKNAKVQVEKKRVERLESLQMDQDLGAVRRRMVDNNESDDDDE